MDTGEILCLSIEWLLTTMLALGMFYDGTERLTLAQVIYSILFAWAVVPILLVVAILCGIYIHLDEKVVFGRRRYLYEED
jgi:hypothetical protein